MDDLTEALTFESPGQIKERRAAPRKKLEETIIKQEPPPPQLSPIWEAYWSIKTDTPESFAAWLLLRPPREDIYITNKANDVGHTKALGFTGAFRSTGRAIPYTHKGML